MNANAITRRWMLVDDNEAVLDLMREAVAHFGGAPVECFSSPCDALTAFQASPADFELIITDLEMPGMNGVELCRQIHALAPMARVLLATGSGLVTEEAAAHAGFSGLLQKPFPLAALRNLFEALRPGHRSARPAAFATT